LKELVENSLDAGATKIEVNINDGGKSYLSVQDNGSGIELSDMDLVLERYATSKIQTDEDLYHIASYGFRGEALASIAEVSKTTIITKTKYAEIGTKLVKKGGELIMKHLPVGFEHGTIVSVEDLFFNVPARLKFLKSAQTEFFYCYNYFVEVALRHYDKERVMKKNDKVNFDLKPARELKDRIVDIFKKDWKKNLKSFEVENASIKLSGVVSDASLRFGSGENIKIYVNGRPIQDKIIRKALMDAYARQITPGEFPFVVLMVEIDPKLVDVNVHPSKLNVKFADSQAVYKMVYDTISGTLGGEKIASFSHNPRIETPLRFAQTPFSGGNTTYSPSANLPSVEQLFQYSEEKNGVSQAKVSQIF
jgi:DNA mismatch repair protein MutL